MTIDAARARHETRHVEVFDAGTHFRDTEWAPFIAAVNLSSPLSSVRL